MGKFLEREELPLVSGFMLATGICLVRLSSVQNHQASALGPDGVIAGQFYLAHDVCVGSQPFPWSVGDKPGGGVLFDLAACPLGATTRSLTITGGRNSIGYWRRAQRSTPAV